METKQLLTRAALSCAAALSITSISHATPLSLAWSSSSDPSVTGYYLWYGTNGIGYSNVINVVGTNEVAMPPLVSNRLYYLTVTSHDINGLQSAPANEITYSTALPTSIQPGSVTYTTSGGLPSGVTIGSGASVVVAPGARVTFAPSVVVAPPVAYAWRFNGAPIKGATNLTFIIPSAAVSNAGSYLLSVSNFTGSVLSGPMTLQVVPILASTYNGLFYQTNANGTTNFNTTTSGMLGNMVIGSSGIYSGRVYSNNGPFAFSGSVDLYGNSTAVVSPFSVGPSNLFVSFHLNSALSAAQLTGYLSNMDRSNPWVASVVADSGAANNLPVSIGVVLVPAPGIYTNNGLCTASNYSGQCYVMGVLPSGDHFVNLEPVSSIGRVPVYSALYHGLGLIEGWMQFANNVPRGTLTWVQNPMINVAYPRGFTNLMTIAP